MDDETLLKTVKNGLMIAGHEMGPVGDHWPAINSIIKGVEKEFIENERDEAVIGELEFHIANALREVEEAAQTATPEMKEKIMKFSQDMWDRYYAILEPIESKHKPTAEELLGDDAECLKSLRSASYIIKGLGGRA